MKRIKMIIIDIAITTINAETLTIFVSKLFTSSFYRKINNVNVAHGCLKECRFGNTSYACYKCMQFNAICISIHVHLSTLSADVRVLYNFTVCVDRHKNSYLHNHIHAHAPYIFIDQYNSVVFK